MFRLQTRPILSLLLAVLALGSLAALREAGEPEPLPCQPEETARNEPRPGFVTLAGTGDLSCARLRTGT